MGNLFPPNCTIWQYYHDISLATVPLNTTYIHTGGALIYVIGRVQEVMNYIHPGHTSNLQDSEQLDMPRSIYFVKVVCQKGKILLLIQSEYKFT